MPRYSYHEIGSRTEFSHKMFYQIEGYLSHFLDYVPFDYNHLKVYSLKLVTVMLEIGPELMNSFELAVSELAVSVHVYDDGFLKDSKRLWEKEERLRKRKRSLTFNEWYCFLDKYLSPKLCSATVQLKGFDAYTMPFEKNNPEWWDSYNRLKHDKYNNLKRANLRTALKASSALFWLVDRNSRMFSFGTPFLSNLFLRIEPYRLNSSLKKL